MRCRYIETTLEIKEKPGNFRMLTVVYQENCYISVHVRSGSSRILNTTFPDALADDFAEASIALFFKNSSFSSGRDSFGGTVIVALAARFRPHYGCKIHFAQNITHFPMDVLTRVCANDSSNATASLILIVTSILI